MSLLYSIIESPLHLDFSRLYHELNIEERHFGSTRKAMMALKKQAPDFILAEFIYGFSNNYAGINISNLDVLLYALQKYAPECKVMILCNPGECSWVDQLNDIFPLWEKLPLPVSEDTVKQALLKTKPDGS